MDILRGKKEDYRLTGLIGKGGMCQVYDAVPLCGGEECAVKIIRSDRGEDFMEKARMLFENEKLILKRLTDSGVIGVPGFIDEGDGFMVMEKVQGTVLQKFMTKRNKDDSSRRALELLLRLSKVLTGLHELDPPVIHMDIKPSNVMITASGEVYLIDFGSAVTLYGYASGKEREQVPGTGTIRFAAPEQYGNIFVRDIRTDIYQFGRLAEAVAASMVTDRYLKSALTDIICRCTMAKAAERYPCMRDVSSDIRSLMGNSRRNRLKFTLKELLHGSNIRKPCLNDEDSFFIDIVMTCDSINF